MESMEQEYKKKLAVSIDKLLITIGNRGTIRVIQAYLNDIDKVEGLINKNIDLNNIEELKHLGHRYKASSQSVGAVFLANLFISLEKVDNLENVIDLQPIIKSELLVIKNKLNECLVFLQWFSENQNVNYQ